MKRYPLQPLAALLGMDLGPLGKRLGVSGRTWQEYRDQGVSEKVADRMAVKCGLDPYCVWPEMLDDAIAATEAEQRAKRKAYLRAYYLKNRTELLEKQRLRDLADAEVKRKAAKRWYHANKARKRATQRVYEQRQRDEAKRRRQQAA